MPVRSGGCGWRHEPLRRPVQGLKLRPSEAPVGPAKANDPMPRCSELLEQLPGWAPSAAPPFTLEVAGVVYRLTPFARRGRRRAVACEPALGVSFPGTVSRDRIRRARGLDGEVLVFTDPCGPFEVWCWTAGDGGRSTVLHERARGVPRACEPIHRRLGPPAASRACSRARRPAARGAAEAIAAALLRAVGRRGFVAGVEGSDRGADDVHQRLHDLLSDPSGPEPLRALWRATARLRVLDPRCGSGRWLLSAMEALETVHLACLERMQLWLDEVSLTRQRRRVDHLSDFRAVLAAAGDTRRYPSPRAFAREAIVLWNLYGADPDGTRVGRCRRRLADAIGGTEAADALPAAAVNVVQGDPRHGLASRRSVALALAGDPAGGAILRRIVEETEVAARAGRLLREMRVEQGLPGAALMRGFSEVRERLDAIARDLDQLALRRSGIDPADDRAAARWLRRHRPVHPFSEWSPVVQGGGFHLIRGGAA